MVCLTTLADFLISKKSSRKSVVPDFRPVDLFEKFGGKQKFVEKVAIYLQTRYSSLDDVKISLKGFSKDGDNTHFLNIRIYSPCEFRKGVKVENILDFYGVEFSLNSRGGGGRTSVDGLRRRPPCLSGGGK